MPKDDLLYFGHMLDVARKAIGNTQGINRESYDKNENLRLALIHLVQTLGEAARRVSPEGQARHPEIPWREMIGMRNKIVHDYLGVDEDVIWNVVTVDMPPLVAKLEKIVPSESAK